MFSYLYNAVFYKPLYNGLIYLFNLIPFADAGIVVIIFTIIVKIILFPLSIKATKSQMEMKSIEPQLKEIKEKYKDNKEELSKKTIELYKEKEINPFSGFFVLLIQLPIIIALYSVFLRSGLPNIKTDILYSFIKIPSVINMDFINIVNISEKSIILGIIAALTAYLQMKYASVESLKKTRKEGEMPEFAEIMQMQMKYVFPVMVFFISWSVSSAISLYWITSNVFTIFQEKYIKNKYKKDFM